MPGPLLCSGLAILRLTFLAPAGAECPLGPVRLSVSTRGLSPDRPFGRGPAQRSGAPRGRGGGAGEGPVAEKRRDWEGRRLRRSAHGHPSGGGSRVWRRQGGSPWLRDAGRGGAGKAAGQGSRDADTRLSPPEPGRPAPPGGQPEGPAASAPRPALRGQQGSRGHGARSSCLSAPRAGCQGNRWIGWAGDVTR